MIPLKFHFVWIGRNFPFVNRLAVESVLQTHPGARVIVHYEDPPVGNADWEALKSKVEFLPVDLKGWIEDLPDSLRPACKSLDKISKSYPAGRSNVLRYLILHREGGIYLDFDTLTLKSFLPLLDNPAFIGEEEVFGQDDNRVAGKFVWYFPFVATVFGISYALGYLNARWLGNLRPLTRMNCGFMHLWSARKLNNAVLGSEAGNGFFRKLFETIHEMNPGMRFALGPMLMNRVYETSARNAITRLDKDVFYAIPPSQTYRFFYGPAPVLPEAAIAIHWCSSNHKEFASKLTREFLETSTSNSLYVKLAQEILAKGI